MRNPRAACPAPGQVMLGTRAASSSWHSLNRDAAHLPAAPHPHTHLGDVASAAGTLDMWLGAHKHGHALQPIHSRAHVPVLLADTQACPARAGTPTPLACTWAFSSPHGHALCTQVRTLHTRAHSCILHACACTRTCACPPIPHACRCILPVNCRYLPLHVHALP